LQLQARGARQAADAEHLGARCRQLDGERSGLLVEVRALSERAASLEAQLGEEKRRLGELLRNDERMVHEFDKLSRLTLREAGDQLVRTAQDSFRLAQQEAKGELDQQRLAVEHLVKPVQENLQKLENFISLSEKDRKQEYGDMFRQMQNVAEMSSKVQAEASELKNVLKSSTSMRGRWGEVQLRRVVELAGMVEHCDFDEQHSAAGEQSWVRADLVINLPGPMKIAVDAKVPYAAYEQAQAASEPVRQKQLFMEHARAVRAHVDALAKRAYWDHYVPSCGFTVLFVPGEALLDSALLHDRALWERAAERNILLATPSTLIALLRMAALGWRQESQVGNAAEISALGRELSKRLVKLAGHVDKVGRHLRGAVGSYNEFVGSLESRVLPQARRLRDLGGTDRAMTPLTAVDQLPRSVTQSELERGKVPNETKTA